jgi:hypothetical protein
VDPLVTCVLCAYNYEQYVADAVESALTQDGFATGEVEVVVVDDGSTDGTPGVLAGFGDRIRVVRQENQGPSVATHRGIREARGRYVSLLDADDQWTPDRLRRQLDVLERRPEVGLVHGDMEVIGGDGVRIAPSMFAWSRIPIHTGQVAAVYLRDNEATTSAITLRAELARAVPETPAWAWCRDWWIAAHVAMSHEIVALRTPVARYRVHGANGFAFGTGDDPDGVLKLIERAIKVRAIMLREFPLDACDPRDLGIAWNHHGQMAGHVAQRRGTGLAQVFAVQEDDRAAAAGHLAEARIAADLGDLATAARHATRALAADPFLNEAALLLGRCVEEVPSPVPEVPSRDDLRRRAVSDETSLPELRRLWGELQTQRVERRQAGEAPDPVTGADRAHAVLAVAAAQEAADAGADLAAAAGYVEALAHDPDDAHARFALEDAVRRCGAQPAPTRSADLREQLSGRRASPVGDARSFVALAPLDAVAGDPELLRAWAESIGPDDDATLALYAPDLPAGEAQERALAALAAAGIPDDDGRDLALVAVPRRDVTEAALGRTVHALLAHDRADRALAGLPALRDAEAIAAAARRRWTFDGLGRPLSFAITICAPEWETASSWGDLHFGRAVADELRRRGHEARVGVLPEWDDDDLRACDVRLHLRGLDAYVPRDDETSVLWCISHPELVTAAECDRYDLVFTASPRHAAALREEVRPPVAVLEQATDPAAFFPDADPAHARDLVMVGNSRGVFRPIVRDLLPTPRDLAIWGGGWEPFVDRRLIAGDHLDPDGVRRAYASAGAVLNDHWDDMRETGFVSNRVYDVLAAGGVLISDDLLELRDRFGDAVLTYRDREELAAHVERCLGDRAARAARAAEGRELVLEQHTFARRVDALLDALAGVPAPSAG